METIIFNNENNLEATMETINKQWEQKTSYGESAKKSKLSKLKTMRISLINNENNFDSTMETIMFNNENNK